MKKKTGIFIGIIILGMLVISGMAWGMNQNTNTIFTNKDKEVLSLWTENSEAKAALISYVKMVTDDKSDDFIPEADRIAVFDLDGTLFCETDPIYIDWYMYVYRVLEDESYKKIATEEQISVANRIREAITNGSIPEGLEEDHAVMNAQIYAGMTLDEFKDYVKSFMNQPAVGYNGMTRGEAYYKPMLEVVRYLQDNGFTVYICSGTDRFEVRTLIDGTISVPEQQVIGTDVTIVARNQGDTDGLDYVFDDNDELVRGDKLIVKNVKMNKVSVIMQEIGRQPVLSFGNSSGDFSMAKFVVNDNPHKSMAFMLCCDDIERENGNVAKAEKMAQICKENGWVSISMKNDWTTIYGDDISKK